MFRIANFKVHELFKPGHVRIIAELLDSDVCVAVGRGRGRKRDRQIGRHVERLARRLRCGIGRPLYGRTPWTLSRNAVRPIDQA